MDELRAGSTAALEEIFLRVTGEQPVFRAADVFTS
jgi:hypothetical protein